MTRLLLTALLALPLLSACASNGSANSAPGETSGFQLAGRHWKLVELNGQEIGALPREAFINLSTDGGRVNGSGGCNGFFGTYELLPEKRIRFTGIGATKMACATGMETEQAFVDALRQADSYVLTGSDLSLTIGKSTTLARFEAVN